MSQNSNIDEVTAWLEGWLDTVDFTLPGAGQGLGQEIIHTIASGIQKRASQDKCDSDHVPWEANADNPPGHGYASYKERAYGWVDQPNYRTGQTWSLLNLIGTSKVTPKEVTMEGGLDVAPSRSVAPSGYMSRGDRLVTGREKLQLAHEHTRNRPMRPGYAIADEDVVAVIEVCTESVSNYVVATNNTNVGP